MNQHLKRLSITVFIIAFTLMSCRKEDMELIQGPEEEVLVANSTLANLMQQTAMNDGSYDNIIDRANCFNIKLPIALKANNTTLNINSEDDLSAVEYIFDSSDDDDDDVEIIFPVTIVLSDFREVVLNNLNELYSYSSTCNGENESDSDIECLDFKYPIKASIFNTSNEILETLNLVNDKQLYHFIKDINQNVIVNLEFPIKVTLMDNTEISLNNLIELKNTIETYKDVCDEDDDFDYSDDDCNTCTVEKLKTFLIDCDTWIVDKLKRNNYDYDDVYEGYAFKFMENGAVSVYWSGYEAYGTWTANGFGNELTVVIDIPGLPYCNNNWLLHEIQSYSDETRIDLRVENKDRLRYINNCN